MANRLIKYELGGGAGVAEGGDYGKQVVGDNFPVTSSTGMMAVATDFSGNVYVADIAQSAVYQITEGGRVRLYAGGIRGFASGALGVGRIDNPTALACDKTGNIYIADTANNRIRKVDTNGNLSTIAGGFNSPQGVAVMPNGDLVVADTNNHKIWRVLQSGTYYLIAGSTEGDVAGESAGAKVKGSTAKFSYPMGVAVDSSGNIYVADSRNYKVKKIDSSGWVTTYAGSTRGNKNTSNPLTSRLYLPVMVQVNRSGTVFVLDKVSGKGRIKAIDHKVGVATVSYLDTTNYSRGFAVSPANKLFVAMSSVATGVGTGVMEYSSSSSSTSSASSVSSVSSVSSSLSSVSSVSSVSSSLSSVSSESSSGGSSLSSLSSESSSGGSSASSASSASSSSSSGSSASSSSSSGSSTSSVSSLSSVSSVSSSSSSPQADFDNTSSSTASESSGGSSQS